MADGKRRSQPHSHSRPCYYIAEGGGVCVLIERQIEAA